MEEEKRKRGRPKKGSSKSKSVCIRLSDEDFEMLEYICDKTGDSKTEAMLSALKTRYNLAKFQ